MQKVLHLLGWFMKLFLLSQTSLSFVLKNLESIVLFAIQLIKTSSQKIITFNESMFYFYLISV